MCVTLQTPPPHSIDNADLWMPHCRIQDCCGRSYSFKIIVGGLTAELLSGSPNCSSSGLSPSLPTCCLLCLSPFPSPSELLFLLLPALLHSLSSLALLPSHIPLLLPPPSFKVFFGLHPLPCFSNAAFSFTPTFSNRPFAITHCYFSQAGF